MGINRPLEQLTVSALPNVHIVWTVAFVWITLL